MKQFGFIFIILLLPFVLKAQPLSCILKPPQFTIHFGSDNVRDLNTGYLSNYELVSGSCPTDGHYSFASHTSACFNDDWHTLSEDHTVGDTGGNMLLVNAAWNAGEFLNTPVTGLKSNTRYELSLWLINLCKPSDNCPYILLPSLSIRLETPEGKIISKFSTQDLPRVQEPLWSQHRAMFTTPVLTSTLQLVMTDNAPGGCGNDFALDDITFRECEEQVLQPVIFPKTRLPTRQAIASKPSPKKLTPPQQTKTETARVIKVDTVSKTIAVTKRPLTIFPATPLILKTRENALVREIETNAGEIKINIYDNGEIDGDTVSIYHNNALIRSHIGLSQKPISIAIGINPSQPHHELIMVAENLGSIPPNTSVMTITTANDRYEVFISSSKQKNAKVVFDLKK
ncbi:MAG: hypothetical protein ACHQFX_18465 [Chitinophagales bacterium]